MNNWGLTTCVWHDEYVIAVRRSDASLAIPDQLRSYPGLAAALDDWEAAAEVLRNLDVDGLPAVFDARPVATIRYPRKLIGVGANYHDHVAEMGAPRVPEGADPFFFFVPPTTAMIGDGESILVPPDRDLRVDWEAELAVVIGHAGRSIAVGDALQHVAGYACFNDISARALMRKVVPLAEPFTWDWAACKGLDTFCPMGPVTPSWMVHDPNDLTIKCTVNGVVKQDGSTSNFIRTVQELISDASTYWTLQPGDVIATGTPAGVGHPRGVYLAVGDEVRVDIGGCVPLTNTVAVRPR